VGLFDFFSRRRKRESAMEAERAELGSFASPEGQPVVGQQVEGAQQLAGGLDLSQLGPMIQSAIEQGNVTIEQGPAQTIDMRGSGLREEILGIMKQHGIDADAKTDASINAGDYPDMQKQILEALSKHGVNIDGSQPPQSDSS
jgi:septum formation topological specificity factor MinE